MRRVCKFLALVCLVLITAKSFADQPAKLTSKQLDAMVLQEFPEIAKATLAGDELFLRRASLDLIGRPPTPEELAAFAKDQEQDRRARAIERLLASKEFGSHWANYWTDTISYKVPPPELTFLSYKKFKAWLAERFNRNVGWDQITRDLLAASGTIKENPAVTYIGYHQGRPAKLAAETARVFMGLQLQCAECHHSKFDNWKREQFHGLAAYFGRTSGKLGKAQDGSSTEIKDLGKGEYAMPNVKDPKQKGKTMAPVFLTGESLKLDTADQERRNALATLVTQPTNSWFAKAYVNRMWARLMGRGFQEPVDNLGDYITPVLPKVQQAMADHFVAAKFEVKDFFRLVMNSEGYQRVVPLGQEMAKKATGPGKTSHIKLNGDDVFQSLVTALGLPNLTPPAMKATAEIRFPPPPKSTRDIIAEKFGYDPSLCPEEVSRTLGQAMLLMNNQQVQAQINATPGSGTRLSKLLEEQDDRVVVVRLFYQVLARQPNEPEIGIALEHLREVGQRATAFEDILWGLINSAEFTTKR